jgi:hypothetical protein
MSGIHFENLPWTLAVDAASKVVLTWVKMGLLERRRAGLVDVLLLERRNLGPTHPAWHHLRQSID